MLGRARTVIGSARSQQSNSPTDLPTDLPARPALVATSVARIVTATGITVTFVSYRERAMEHCHSEPQFIDLHELIEPALLDDRMIFDPVEPGGAVEACGKCGKCGKSARGDDFTDVENDLNELQRHIHRNPEILRDIMERWNIEPRIPGKTPGKRPNL